MQLVINFSMDLQDLHVMLIGLCANTKRMGFDATKTWVHSTAKDIIFGRVCLMLESIAIPFYSIVLIEICISIERVDSLVTCWWQTYKTFYCASLTAMIWSSKKTTTVADRAFLKFCPRAKALLAPFLWTCTTWVWHASYEASSNWGSISYTVRSLCTRTGLRQFEN